MTTINLNSSSAVLSRKLESEQFSLLYERLKVIYKSAMTAGIIDENSESEVLEIQEVFKNARQEQGILYCQKALSVIFEKRGDLATVTTEKLRFYESAHDFINQAAFMAAQIKWEQPSLLKHQGILKSKLGDVLHQSGDHTNANILESDAFKIFGKMLHNYPNYAEGLLAYSNASFNKMKWQMHKLLFDLGRTEILLKDQIHTRYQPNPEEMSVYESQIREMRQAISILIANAEHQDNQNQ